MLIMGCCGTIASLLIVGFSLNFWMALVGRLVGGALNGNIGVIQTMVGELVTNPSHEPKAYAIMPFIWSIGIIIGPAIGGFFATPVHNFPGTVLDNALFAKFPYLLPNLICTGLMVISIIAGYFCLKETHPDMQPWSTEQDLRNTSAVTPLLATQAGAYDAPADLSHESYGTFNNVFEEAVEDECDESLDCTSRTSSLNSAQKEKWFTRRVGMLMVALGIFTYHSMTYDHLLPIFSQDDRVPGSDQTMGTKMVASSIIGNEYGSFAGGLGLSVKACGVILAFNGIIALLIQGVIFPVFASWLGIYKTLIFVTLLHPVAYFVVPWLALLPPAWLYPGIYACLTIRNFLSILAYPVLLILIKEASPSNSCLGKINGLAASTGAACRTMASPIAGLLYGEGDKIDFTALAWWGSAVVAVIGALQVFMVKRHTRGPHHRIRPAASFSAKFTYDGDETDRRKSSAVRISVSEGASYGTIRPPRPGPRRWASRVHDDTEDGQEGTAS